MRPIWIILILLQKSLSKIHFSVWCDFYCLIFCKLHVKFLWFLNFLWQLSGINRQSCTTESVISSPDCMQSILCNLYGSLLFQALKWAPVRLWMVKENWQTKWKQFNADCILGLVIFGLQTLHCILSSFDWIY